MNPISYRQWHTYKGREMRQAWAGLLLAMNVVIWGAYVVPQILK
jgi:hypothetical protein